jgi:hydroxypyruvate isomerase
MREKRKDGLSSHGFLLDRDVSKVSSLFPKKRTKTLAGVGLSENARDSEIVRKAWERGLTIVTGNGDDFVREINAFQSRTKRNDCHELHGLVVLPNGYEHQKRLLQDLQDNLRLGSEILTWADVAQKNCLVRVKKNGKPEVRRFQRCFYCQKLELA